MHDVPLLTIDEAAIRLNITSEHAYALHRKGILPTVAVGRRVRVDPEQLAEFIRAGGQGIKEAPDAPRQE